MSVAVCRHSGAQFPAQVLYLITDNLTLVELAEPYLRIVGFSYIFNSLASIYIGMQRASKIRASA